MKKELNTNLKDRFIVAATTSGRFFCEKRLFGHRGMPFAERYPEHMKSIEEFWNWIKLKERPSRFQGYVRIAPKKS